MEKVSTKEKELIEADFRSFRLRIDFESHLFYQEVLGRKVQIFLFDLWHIYKEELN